MIEEIAPFEDDRERSLTLREVGEDGVVESLEIRFSGQDFSR